MRSLKVFSPLKIFTASNGDVILDTGQVIAGQIAFSLTADAGHTITLEHSEVMGNGGNFFNNILNVNKEQAVIYITNRAQNNHPTDYESWPDERQPDGRLSKEK